MKFKKGEVVRVVFPAEIWNGIGVVESHDEDHRDMYYVVKFNRPAYFRGGFKEEFLQKATEVEQLAYVLGGA